MASALQALMAGEVYAQRPAAEVDMVRTNNRADRPFSLVVTGEAESWLPALESIVGHRYLQPHPVSSDRELLDVVQFHRADAAVLDDNADWLQDSLQLLRRIRRVDAGFPVVVVTRHRDRRWLEDALSLAVFSVVVRPLALEELLQQIQRMMTRISQHPGSDGL